MASTQGCPSASRSPNHDLPSVQGSPAQREDKGGEKTRREENVREKRRVERREEEGEKKKERRGRREDKGRENKR